MATFDWIFVLQFVVLIQHATGVYQEQACANRGGTCQLKRHCGGQTIRGLCPTQSRDVLCCLSNNSGLIQQYDTDVYQEQACANRGGMCQLKVYCGGQTLRNLCPTQSRDVLCCFFDNSGLSNNGCGCSQDNATAPTSGQAPGARRLAIYFKNHYGGRTEIHIGRTVLGASSLSLHSEGRAVDLYFSGQNGNNAFDHAVSIACQSGIQEVIFNHRIWTNDGGERNYSGAYPFMDHVHIGLNRCGAQNFNY